MVKRNDLRKNELYVYVSPEGNRGVNYLTTFVLDHPLYEVGTRHYIFQSCLEGEHSYSLGITQTEESISLPNYSVNSLRYFPIHTHDYTALYMASSERQNEFFAISPMSENVRDFLINGDEDDLGILIEQMQRIKVDELIMGRESNRILAINKVIYHAEVKMRLLLEELRSESLFGAFANRVLNLPR